MPLTTMSGEEFVKKLSENEKDFAKIRLKPGTVLDETALRAIGMLQQMAVIDRPSLEPTPDDPFILSRLRTQEYLSQKPVYALREG